MTIDAEQVIATIREMQRQTEHYRGEYEQVYQDLRQLGAALGHEPGALPYSASVLMRMYIEEVRGLRALLEQQQRGAMP